MVSPSLHINQNRKEDFEPTLWHYSKWQMAEVFKNFTHNSCTLFNKTPKEAFDGGEEKSKEESDPGGAEISKLNKLKT